MNYQYDGLGNQERARRIKQNKAMLKKAQAKTMERSKVINELMAIKPFTMKAVASLPKLAREAKKQRKGAARVQKLRVQGYMLEKGK